ncbi:MAG: hypothetical protein U0O22_03975 [Acutalibacteraceae bacterium]
MDTCKNAIRIGRKQYDELIASKKELEMLKGYIGRLPNYADISVLKEVFNITSIITDDKV